MQIDIKLVTIPKTITRKEASIAVGYQPPAIDKAIRRDEIDYAMINRNVLIVVNKKWKDYLKKNKR